MKNMPLRIRIHAVLARLRDPRWRRQLVLHCKIYRNLILIQAAMLVLGIHLATVAVVFGGELGSPVLRALLFVPLLVTLGSATYDLYRAWRWGVAVHLYLQDLYDGVCPDYAIGTSSHSCWRWYRKQGSPWRLRPRRERPQVRLSEAIGRIHDIRVSDHFPPFFPNYERYCEHLRRRP